MENTCSYTTVLLHVVLAGFPHLESREIQTVRDVEKSMNCPSFITTIVATK